MGFTSPAAILDLRSAKQGEVVGVSWRWFISNEYWLELQNDETL